MEKDTFGYGVIDINDTFAYYKKSFIDNMHHYSSIEQRVIEEVTLFYDDEIFHYVAKNLDGELLFDTWYKKDPEKGRLYILSGKKEGGYMKTIEYVSEDSFIVKHYVEKDPANQRSREYTWDGKGNEPENVVSFEETNGGVTIKGTQEDIQNGSVDFHMPGDYHFCRGSF